MLPKTAFADEAEYLAYLRDWFAGQALAGMMSGAFSSSTLTPENAADMAAEVFLVADAMLAARAGLETIKEGEAR